MKLVWITYADKKYKKLRGIMYDTFALPCNYFVLFFIIGIIIKVQT